MPLQTGKLSSKHLCNFLKIVLSGSISSKITFFLVMQYLDNDVYVTSISVINLYVCFFFKFLESTFLGRFWSFSRVRAYTNPSRKIPFSRILKSNSICLSPRGLNLFHVRNIQLKQTQSPLESQYMHASCTSI